MENGEVNNCYCQVEEFPFKSLLIQEAHGVGGGGSRAKRSKTLDSTSAMCYFITMSAHFSPSIMRIALL